MKNVKGFTVLELLIVVAIIGMLSAIAIPQFAAYRAQAYYNEYQELNTKESFKEWMVKTKGFSDKHAEGYTAYTKKIKKDDIDPDAKLAELMKKNAEIRAKKKAVQKKIEKETARVNWSNKSTAKW